MLESPPGLPRAAESATPRVDVVVVQPTPFCNIDCTYCYLPHRNDRTVIEQSTVRNLFFKLFASGWAGRHINVIWHAGEPLVMSIDFYRQAFETIEQLRRSMYASCIPSRPTEC